MLNTLQPSGRDLGREFAHAWDRLAHSGHDLLGHWRQALSGSAWHPANTNTADTARAGRQSCALLAGEVEEIADDIIVRIEAPGMTREDFTISLEGKTLHLFAQEQVVRDAGDCGCAVLGRAYRLLQRAITLPQSVDLNGSQVSYGDGALIVRLPKKNE
jgi:HSP20 family protein